MLTSEKDISLKSGFTVYNELSRSGWKVFLLIINDDEWYIKTSDVENTNNTAGYTEINNIIKEFLLIVLRPQ